ncbi:MAG: hypothetical protein EBT07_19065 [Actinobacteria bacterium]|nr:hypothetical protein [Actinomycetota bacterium]
MNTEQKYLIKYMSDTVNGPDDPRKNLYWGESGERWYTDPNMATRFNNPNGISEVGRLLVEHEWVTRLVRVEEVPMVKPISPPNSGLILVVDCDGDPKEVYSHNCVIDEVMRRCQVLDGEDPSDAPHSAWMWGTGGFSRVFDRIGK